jgi:tRNA-specific 2-thiouridylase
LATGHYARIVEHRGRLLLARALDEQKDQSYMLAQLDPRRLNKIWFPLGDQTKEETRAEAERAGMAVARKPESQEACFLGGGDYREFLERNGLPARQGAVVDESGATIGSHQGFWRVTPGQRRGLGIASGSPAYALGSDPQTNTVVVGPREALARRTVTASGRLFASVTRGDAKIRYRSPVVPASIEATTDGFRLRFDEPAYGVAAGQTAVLYEQDVVVGSGTISSSSP